MDEVLVLRWLTGSEFWNKIRVWRVSQKNKQKEENKYLLCEFELSVAGNIKYNSV